MPLDCHTAHAMVVVEAVVERGKRVIGSRRI